MSGAIYANMGLFGGFVGFGLYFLGLGSSVADFVILNRQRVEMGLIFTDLQIVKTIYRRLCRAVGSATPIFSE